MENLEKKIAQSLLQIKAIKLEPANYFTWASGWKSPIYCDNRKTLSYPEIRKIVKEGFVEEALKDAKPQDKFQFMRNGYFNTDLDSKEGKLIFNEIVPLKSSYK